MHWLSIPRAYCSIILFIAYKKLYCYPSYPITIILAEIPTFPAFANLSTGGPESSGDEVARGATFSICNTNKPTTPSTSTQQLSLPIQSLRTNGSTGDSSGSTNYSTYRTPRRGASLRVPQPPTCVQKCTWYV